MFIVLLAQLENAAHASNICNMNTNKKYINEHTLIVEPFTLFDQKDWLDKLSLNRHFCLKYLIKVTIIKPLNVLLGDT